MKCPHCLANLDQFNRAGEPLLRTRGLVLKASGPVAICPKCGGDVELGGDFARALAGRLLLLPARRTPQT